MKSINSRTRYPTQGEGLRVSDPTAPEFQGSYEPPEPYGLSWHKFQGTTPVVGQIFGRIVSGGQTGADRAALDFAISHQIPHAGWCPMGRLAADGPLGPQYQLQETESGGYRQRTKRNVRDSDATLILNTGELDGGSLQTLRFAQVMGKPYRVFQLDHVDQEAVARQVVEWLTHDQVVTLNVAGPREEKRPGIYALALSILSLCLTGSVGG
jgi:hypothetical protein